MRRKVRVLLAVTAGLVVSFGTAAPAFAGKNVNAPITESCRSGQTMTSVQFVLTEVPKWQKITVRTDGGALTRDHVSFSGETNASGTARYDIAIDSPLTGAPATAYISDNAWTGEFQMTGASCKDPEAPRVSGQGSTCGNEPRISVQVTNPNPRSVTYRVGAGQIDGQNVEVAGGQSQETILEPVDRGRGYQVQARGSDGTVGSAWVTVPACEPIPPTSDPNEPPATTPSQGVSSPPVLPGNPGIPGAPGAPTVPGAPVPSSLQANVAGSAGPSASPTASVTATESVSAEAAFVPETEYGVDPFAPLLKAEGKTTILAAPMNNAKELLSNNGTVLIALGLIVIFAVLLLLARRRSPTKS